MSKTTDKYGKPSYTLRLTVDAEPAMPPHLKAKFAKFDELTKSHYNKPYDALSDKQKVEFHFNWNTGVYKNEALSNQ